MEKSSSSEEESSGKSILTKHTDAVALQDLLTQIHACRICRDAPKGKPLPHEPHPVLRVSSTARLLIAGQAPGTRVHATGIPFNDPSGDRLRQWMGVSNDEFYDVSRIAIVPMGFCFPGLDARKADLPPRPECRTNWHDQLMAALPQIETIVIIGNYARDYHFARLGLENNQKTSLTDIVRNWRNFAAMTPLIIPLPHPSWRNSGWLKRNPWFQEEVVPVLQAEVALKLGKV